MFLRKLFFFISSEAGRLILEALTEHYAVIINSTSDELEEITTNMTGVLDTADGPTILAHTDRMKLREANILKKDNKRHSKGKEKMRKLQGSDKLPHQTSTANRLKCVNEKKNDHPQGKQYHAPTEMDSTNRDSGSRPPRRDRHARKASNNNANARMARLPQRTHGTPPTAHALATSQQALHSSPQH